MADAPLRMYTVIALVLSAVDINFAVKAFRKPDKVGKSMGWSASFAALITLAYLASTRTRDPALVSVCSTLEFIGIDFLLVCLTYYAFLATGIYDRAVSRNTNIILRLLATADSIVMCLNVFTGAAVTYDLLEPYGVAYQMKTPYIVHLVFAYTMVVIILSVLIFKSARLRGSTATSTSSSSRPSAWWCCSTPCSCSRTRTPSSTASTAPPSATASACI